MRLLGLFSVIAVSILILLPSLYYVKPTYQDEGVLLHGASQMIAGKKLYLDFFAFYPPVSYLLTEAGLSMFGQSLLAAHVLAIIVLISIVSVIYMICYHIGICQPDVDTEGISEKMLLSAILPLSWLILINPCWVGVSHHWFSVLFGLISVWLALLSKKNSNSDLGLTLLAGVMAGVATMSTVSFLYVAAAVSVLYWRGSCVKYIIVFCCGFVVVPVLCLFYVFLNHSFSAAYSDILGFTLTRYSSVQRVPFAWGLPWGNPVKDLFPIAGCLAFITYLQYRRSLFAEAYFALFVFLGLAGLVMTYPRPEADHIGFAAPLILPLIAYCYSRLVRSEAKRILRYGSLSILLTYIPIIVLHARAVVTPIPRISSAAGPIAFFASGGNDMLRFINKTSKKDGFFFYPYLPLMPFLTKRDQIAPVDIFVPGYTYPSQYRDSCFAAVQRANWVITGEQFQNPSVWKLSFPAMQDANPPEVQLLSHAIRDNFIHVKHYGIFDVWHRRERTKNYTSCKRIASIP